MTPETAAHACASDDGHCITCGDEGVPMRVVKARSGSALCIDLASDWHEVATDLVEPVHADDRVLVHAGVAIAKLGAGA